MTYDRDDLRLDANLEGLAAGIFERIVLNPPELKAKLRPPQLRVVTGPRGLNSYCVPGPDRTNMILIGADLYPFSCHYTRAAAAYFLPSEPKGPRPSAFWPDACSAVATTLDWISSPATKPVYPEFELTPYQAQVAQAFRAYAYRFALCHEMAHIVLGHVDRSLTEPQRVSGEVVAVFRSSQEQELKADGFGLHLQIKSVPDQSQLVNGLASAMYFVHIMALLDFRLGLLAQLVDYRRWNISYTHPPTLMRVFNLMRAAEGLERGTGSGLQTLHESLGSLDGRLFETANKQQDEVVGAAVNLVSQQVAAHKTLGDVQGEQPSLPGAPPPDVTKELLRLFDRSPLGVMRALESPPIDSYEDPTVTRDPFWFLVTDQLALVLPPEFQRFRRQTPAERAVELA